MRKSRRTGGSGTTARPRSGGNTMVARRRGVLLLCIDGSGHTPGRGLWRGAVCVEKRQHRRSSGGTGGGPPPRQPDLVRAYTGADRGPMTAAGRASILRSAKSIPNALPPSRKKLGRRAISEKRRPLEGIPVLIKDNIATGDAQHTTRRIARRLAPPTAQATTRRHGGEAPAPKPAP